MRIKNKKPIKINNTMFWIINSVMIVILISAIVFEIINCKKHLINYTDEKYENVINSISIASQIIASIATCVLSIIGIAFSLQSNEYFGIKIRDIDKMRVKLRYPILYIFLISISLTFFSVVFYTLKLMALCTGIGLISFIYCFYVLYLEVPMLTQNEDVYKSILKQRFIKAANSNYYDGFNHDDYVRDKFDKALKTLLTEKSLKYVYNYFCIDGQDIYNKNLLLKLLDVEQNIAFRLKNLESKKELIDTADSLKTSMFDILYNDFNIMNILGENYNDYKHFITRALFQLLIIDDNIAKDVSDSLARYMTYGINNFKDENERKFHFSIILSLISSLIRHDNFILLNEIKKQYSLSYFSLSSNNDGTLLFAILSMYLYYLSEIETDTSENLKQQIQIFIDDGYIVENTQVLSWKFLFKQFVHSFSISYENYISICDENDVYLEFMNFSPFAKNVLYDKNFLTDWYLTMLFNSERIYKCDFSQELSYLTHNKHNYYLEKFIENNFKDGVFTPTEKLTKMAQFYLSAEGKFEPIRIFDNISKNLIDYYSELKIHKLEEDAENYSKITNQNLIERYKSPIFQKLTSDYGYDSNIDMTDCKQKFISVLYERTSNAINHDECLIDYFVNGIFYDITSGLESTVINKDSDLDVNVDKVLKKDISAITDSFYWRGYCILSEDIKNKFFEKLNNVDKISSHILTGAYAILKNGFSYNFTLDNFIVRDLTESELNSEIDKYMREDGQYIYEGLFLSREKIAELIKNKYVGIIAIFKQKVKISRGSLIKIV